MDVAVIVFTRDLRVSDHAALARATSDAARVVPLFVFDDTILTGSFNCPNRTGFLLESLEDLDGALHDLGGNLVTRRGPWVPTVAELAREVGAGAIYMSNDVSDEYRATLDSLRR